MNHPLDQVRPRLAIAFAGGAARGLAHIGVLEVLEREGIPPDCIAGSSMGGLIGALSARGLCAGEIMEVARQFYFPRWFLPGGLVRFEDLFRSAVPHLAGTFEELRTLLVVTAVDIESGSQIVLHTGKVFPAVRATCTVPGVFPVSKVAGHWLVDGGLVNILPVDVAWMANPDLVIAVKVGAVRHRRVPELNWRVTSLLSRLGGMIPNPATAKVSFEVLVRSAEIILDRQTSLAAAMTGPEVLIEPDLGDITLRDFHRLDDAVAAGRRAAEAALPGLVRLLANPPRQTPPADRVLSLRFDPVCAMVINPAHARATFVHERTTYYFCSPNCRDCFERDPGRYTGKAPLAFAAGQKAVRSERNKESTEARG